MVAYLLLATFIMLLVEIFRDKRLPSFSKASSLNAFKASLLGTEVRDNFHTLGCTIGVFILWNTYYHDAYDVEPLWVASKCKGALYTVAAATLGSMAILLLQNALRYAGGFVPFTASDYAVKCIFYLFAGIWSTIGVYWLFSGHNPPTMVGIPTPTKGSLVAVASTSVGDIIQGKLMT